MNQKNHSKNILTDKIIKNNTTLRNNPTTETFEPDYSETHRPDADKLKSDGSKTLNPSGFAVLGCFTATVKGRAAVKVTVKLKKSVESTLFELDFKNFARSCKLNKTPHILTVADKSANKKARPKWSGFNRANFNEFTVQIGDNLRYCRFAFNI